MKETEMFGYRIRLMGPGEGIPSIDRIYNKPVIEFWRDGRIISEYYVETFLAIQNGLTLTGPFSDVLSGLQVHGIQRWLRQATGAEELHDYLLNITLAWTSLSVNLDQLTEAGAKEAVAQTLKEMGELASNPSLESWTLYKKVNHWRA